MLGERLKHLRSYRNLTQEEVSSLLGITRARYAQYEIGVRNPDYDILNKLASFYDTTTDYLLGRIEEDLDGFGLDTLNLFQVPIIGNIQCGEPMFAESNIEGYMYVDKSIVRVNSKDNLFYLRVSGDSMAPKFQPDDLVLVRQQPAVDDGDIAVVLVNNEEATLKKFFSSNGTVWLHSLNSVYEPMRYKAEEVRIIGKALLRVGTV